MSREAMQMALEALEDANDVARMEFSDEDYYSEAINALRQALEEKQEPVAWISDSPTKGNGKQLHWTKSEAWRWSSNITPLYTAPPKREWVGLTDEELKPLCDENHIMFGAYTVDFIQAIEAKLKEKNHG
jgi:hypothetical protein